MQWLLLGVAVLALLALAYRYPRCAFGLLGIALTAAALYLLQHWLRGG